MQINRPCVRQSVVVWHGPDQYFPINSMKQIVRISRPTDLPELGEFFLFWNRNCLGKSVGGVLNTFTTSHDTRLEKLKENLWSGVTVENYGDEHLHCDELHSALDSSSPLAPPGYVLLNPCRMSGHFFIRFEKPFQGDCDFLVEYFSRACFGAEGTAIVYLDTAYALCDDVL